MIRIVEWLAGRLPAEERDAVLGDLTEVGSSHGQAIRELLGLITRRQLLAWTDWRPWIALFGLVIVIGMLLSEFVFRFLVALHQQLATYWPYGTHQENGLSPGENVLHLVCVFLALFAWTWTSGFVLGCLSGRTIWFTAPLFWLVCLDSFGARLRLYGAITVNYRGGAGPSFYMTLLNWIFPFNLSTALFLCPVLWGVVSGLRSRAPAVRTAWLIATATLLLGALVFWTGGWQAAAMTAWSEGAIQVTPWTSRLFPLTLLSLPALYMLWIASIRSHRTRTL